MWKNNVDNYFIGWLNRRMRSKLEANRFEINGAIFPGKETDSAENWTYGCDDIFHADEITYFLKWYSCCSKTVKTE